MMDIVYRVRDYPIHFETAESRKRKGPLSWVAIPTKHDGRSYKRLTSLPHGPIALLGWWALLQVAAKMPVRGLLADRDGPLDAEDLAIKCNLPKKVFITALNMVSDEKIGWLEKLDWDKNLKFNANLLLLPESAVTPADTGRSQQTPADTGRSQQTPADSGRSQQAKKGESIPRSTGRSQQTPADTGRSQQTPADSGRSQQVPADSSPTVQYSTLPVPPTVPQGGQERERSAKKVFESLTPVERDALRQAAKVRICKFRTFKGKNPTRPWSYAAMAALDQHLPIPEEEWEAVEWFHGLAPSDEIQELKNRRQSETTLMENWADEVSRSLRYRQNIHGCNGEAEKKKEPPLWREFCRWHYDNQEIVMPASYWQLGPDQKKNYERNFETFLEAHPEVVVP